MISAHGAGFDETVENALKFGQDDAKYGQITLDLNYRYEHADIKGTKPEPANGITTASRPAIAVFMSSRTRPTDTN